MTFIPYLYTKRFAGLPVRLSNGKWIWLRSFYTSKRGFLSVEEYNSLYEQWQLRQMRKNRDFYLHYAQAGAKLNPPPQPRKAGKPQAFEEPYAQLADDWTPPVPIWPAVVEQTPPVTYTSGEGGDFAGGGASGSWDSGSSSSSSSYSSSSSCDRSSSNYSSDSGSSSSDSGSSYSSDSGSSCSSD